MMATITGDCKTGWRVSETLDMEMTMTDDDHWGPVRSTSREDWKTGER